MITSKTISILDVHYNCRLSVVHTQHCPMHIIHLDEHVMYFPQVVCYSPSHSTSIILYSPSRCHIGHSHYQAIL